MKLIYMEQTLNLMTQQDIKAVNDIVSTGIVKHAEIGTYLVIETNQQEQI
jgi:hypothetical protein